MKSFPKIFMRVRNILTIRLVMKEIQSVKSKCYAILLVLVMLTGILILSPTILSLMNTYTHVRSSGTIVANEAHANSGSVEDIQAGVDAVVAAGGGILHIPEGVFTFNASGDRRVNINVPAGGLNIFGAGINRTVLQMPVDDSAPNTIMFYVNGLSKGRFRTSGITFKGRPNRDTSPTGDTGIRIESCKDFRVDNCSFYDMGTAGVWVNDEETQYGISGGDLDRVSQGVVDHCYFYDIYKKPCTDAKRGYGYGVVVARASHYLWTLPNLYPDPWTMFGAYSGNTFIEDCYFIGCRHAAVGNWAGAYVLRYSTIEDLRIYESVTTGHPVRENVLGMLTQEIYNVTVKSTGRYVSTFIAFLVEGGSALLFNNTLENLNTAFRIGCCEVAGNSFYHTGGTKELYIWDNNLTNCATFVEAYSNEPGGCPAPVENVHYFLHAPPAERNYTPYTYPHPLTLEQS